MTQRDEASGQGREAGPRAHLPREVALVVEVHVLVLLAVHAQAELERLLVGTESELEFAEAVEEFGQVPAHLGGERAPELGAQPTLPGGGSKHLPLCGGSPPPLL